MNDMLALISQHEVFEVLSEEELASLEQVVHRREIEKGEELFSFDKAPEFLFYIESGSFSLHLASNEFKILRPGQLFGEIGIINNDFRSGTVTAIEFSVVIAICGSRLFNEKYVSSTIALKIIRALSKRITNYLRSKEQISTKEIIEEGENGYVEFKSTLRLNLYTGKKDKAIENASLKTLAAFMNAEGGILLIGVKDDGTILGLEQDGFANHDRLLLHLTSLVKARIGSLYLKFLHFSIEKIEDKKVLRINCTPSTIPVYLNDGNLEHFYTRTGPATTDLRLSKIYEYIKERFEK